MKNEEEVKALLKLAEEEYASDHLDTIRAIVLKTRIDLLREILGLPELNDVIK